MGALKSMVNLLLKVFFLGLLLQFLLHTFVTYKIGQTGGFWDMIWLWKEFVLLILLVIVGVFMVKRVVQVGWKRILDWCLSLPLRWFIFSFLLCVGVSFFLAIGVQGVGLGAYVLSVKYNLLGFLIFLLGVALVGLFSLRGRWTNWYNQLLKWIIYGGFVWWGIIVFLPSFLKLFGYSRNSFEGTLSGNPPAVYYTQINHGLARNQFVFERPISFGFFLVAFWPLFALTYLRKQSRKVQIAWTLAFGIMVISTFSRAAIGVWILQTGILAFLLYRRWAKKLILYGGIPAILILVSAFFYFKSAFVREHSNTGHWKLLISGIDLAMEHPIVGWGAGYSGPASHQLCFQAENNPRCEQITAINQKYSMETPGYNPENQYVQIWMEYGVLGLLPWLFCFGWLLWQSLCVIFYYLREVKKGRKADQKLLTQLLTTIGFGLGLRGLAVEGLVLHSFVDRMIVYPFMLLFGLWYGQVLDEHAPFPNNDD